MLWFLWIPGNFSKSEFVCQFDTCCEFHQSGSCECCDFVNFMDMMNFVNFLKNLVKLWGEFNLSAKIQISLKKKSNCNGI